MRHADVDSFHLWNGSNTPQANLETLVDRIAPDRRQPIRWIGALARNELGDAGVLYRPDAFLDHEAWLRLPFGRRAFALCGITHTTATARVMRMLSDLLVAPLEPYDALICTSAAVRAAVEVQLDMMRAYLRAEFGERTRPELMRVTIPLGVNTGEFTPDPADRAAWRERLGVPDDAVVALYVGRFDVRAKMNPGLMAMALERAARRTSRPICWLNSGWFEPAEGAAAFHDQVRALCPSVQYLHVDGRPADTRFSIWAAGDFFISLSDNIQETFGLTPVEAMAAGLPCVVSDWNGYKDTVRHGVDGFRVPTVAPRPGFGADLAYWFANHWLTYDNYVGATAQSVAVDLAEAETAILALVDDDDRRRDMGAAAARRAREVFDWAAVIPQYQALWAEQDARRRAAPPDSGFRPNPYAPDPYALFGGYPTRQQQKTDVVALVPGMDWASAQAHLAGPLTAYARFNRPTIAELELVIGRLASDGPTPVLDLLHHIPTPRRNHVERGLLWLARHDVISIRPAS
jgi:glycosyltransferase involved in cell wall biosynthesis